jgi:hypothetical protein
MAAGAVLQNEFDGLEWEPVVSTNVQEIAYVPYAGRCWVRFLRKPDARYTVYFYENVSQGVWDAFRTAPSKGTFVDQVFKKGGYSYYPFM